MDAFVALAGILLIVAALVFGVAIGLLASEGRARSRCNPKRAHDD
jgi:uncharacterized protein YneF (UPF0154 family)